MKFSRHLVLSALSVLALTACQSSPKTQKAMTGEELPIWVLNPQAEGALAASSCVLASNDFNMDKSQAASAARVELANQIDTQLARVVEEYGSKVTSMGKAYDKTVFESTTAQFTDQALRGSKVVKVDYAMMGNNQKNLCVLTTISDKDAQALVTELLNKAPVQLGPENETLMFLKFTRSEKNSK